MHEPRVGADDLGEMRREGKDVVLGLAFDLVDACDVESNVFRLGPDRLCGVLGNDAKLGLRIGGVGLDLEPDFEAGLRFPDRSHFRAGITGNHRGSFS